MSAVSSTCSKSNKNTIKPIMTRHTSENIASKTSQRYEIIRECFYFWPIKIFSSSSFDYINMLAIAKSSSFSGIDRPPS